MEKDAIENQFVLAAWDKYVKSRKGYQNKAERKGDKDKIKDEGNFIN